MAGGDRNTTYGKNLIKPVIIGGFTAFIISILLIFLCSFMIFHGWIEYSMMRRLAIASCAISGFIGSLISIRRFKHFNIPFGLCIGTIEFILLLTAGILATERNSFNGSLLPLLIACLCSGALAGLLGKKRRKRRHV